MLIQYKAWILVARHSSSILIFALILLFIESLIEDAKLMTLSNCFDDQFGTRLMFYPFRNVLCFSLTINQTFCSLVEDTCLLFAYKSTRLSLAHMTCLKKVKLLLMSCLSLSKA